jgi:uncharacterized protein
VTVRLVRVDLEGKVAADHERTRATTSHVARIGGARVNARWHREFLAYAPRGDLARIPVPVLAVTGGKDLQVLAADLDTTAATVPGPVTTLCPPDLTHTLRRQPGPASLRAYRGELRQPGDGEVLDTVASWCRRVAADASPSRAEAGRGSGE